MTNPHQLDVRADALESYLRGAAMRRMSHERAAEVLASVWRECEGARAAPQPELLPLRIMVMWRLVRATALTKNLCAEEELLDDATQLDPDPWTIPFKAPRSPSLHQALRRGTASKLQVLHSEGEGLPLLPPRDDPAALERWCTAAGLIARDVGIGRTQEGLLGLRDLLEPATAAMCDVTDRQVIDFEEMMVEQTSDLLLDSGERAAVRHYREHFGLSRKECSSLIRLVKAEAMRRTNATLEEKRAMQESRLEDFLGRAREAMNMDDEMKALKELGKIQGLTRTDPESNAMELLQVIRRVSARQDAEQLEAPRTIELLPSRAEEREPQRLLPEPNTDPDDEAFLAEYDMENR